MFSKTKCFLFFLSYIVIESNANVASFIKPCKWDDKSCLVSSAQAAIPYVMAGIKEFGIQPVEPLFIDFIYSDASNLKLNFTNNKIVGPSKSKILELVRDVEKQTIKLVLETPLLINGKYDLHGKILILSAVGNGDYDLKTDKIKITAVLKYKIVEKDGKKYWKIIGFDYSYDLVDKIYIKLDNLFGGDKTAAKPLEQLLDERWKDIIEELGDPIIKTILTAYCNVIKEIFKNISTDILEIA